MGTPNHGESSNGRLSCLHGLGFWVSIMIAELTLESTPLSPKDNQQEHLSPESLHEL